MEYKERFLKKIHFSGPNSCWYWTAAKDRDGYGQFRLNGRMEQAHRVAYQLWVGPIPEGLVVRHKCDNPICVHPTHLELGTQADNVRDRDERGRRAATHGVENGNSKLTDDDVQDIRARYAEGGVSLRALAKEYGVNFTHVSRIVNRKIWTHI